MRGVSNTPVHDETEPEKTRKQLTPSALLFCFTLSFSLCHMRYPWEGRTDFVLSLELAFMHFSCSLDSIRLVGIFAGRMIPDCIKNKLREKRKNYYEFGKDQTASGHRPRRPESQPPKLSMSRLPSFDGIHLQKKKGPNHNGFFPSASTCSNWLSRKHGVEIDQISAFLWHISWLIPFWGPRAECWERLDI